jgi:APA family basic amino acid/polyamine antiporter/amino acid efflux transporter
VNDEPKQLVRSLSVPQGVALAASLVIGSGVLGLPGIVLQEIGPQYAALAWVVTAVAMIPFIVVFARLGAFFPSSPGLLAYAEFAFGKAGRNAASLMLLSCVMIGFPALLLIGGSYVQAFAGMDAQWVPPFAMAILTLAAALNLIGLRMSASFNAASILILAGFMLFVTLYRSSFFLAAVSMVANSWDGVFRNGREGAMTLWKGCALIFWAFLGWENVGFGAQEIKNPQRAIPLIFGLSFLFVTTLFLMLAFTNIGAAATGDRSTLGPAGLVSLLDSATLKSACALVFVILIVGNANAWMYTVSRMLLAEAKDGILPRSLGKLSSRLVPVRCILLCFVVVIASIAIGWLAHWEISDLILLVNQNFLLLFLASIWAYASVETSRIRFVVVPAAVLTCSLFLSGFSAWIFFPLGLIVLGWVMHLSKRRAAA